MSSFYADTWYHIAWSWNENENNLYINGKLENSTTGSRPVSGDGNDEIGRSLYDISNIAGGGPLYFNDTLDEFRIGNAFTRLDKTLLCESANGK